MALISVIVAGIPFSPRFLNETEQDNAENDNQFSHCSIIQQAKIMIKIIFQNFFIKWLFHGVCQLIGHFEVVVNVLYVIHIFEFIDDPEHFLG